MYILRIFADKKSTHQAFSVENLSIEWKICLLSGEFVQNGGIFVQNSVENLSRLVENLSRLVEFLSITVENLSKSVEFLSIKNPRFLYFQGFII